MKKVLVSSMGFGLLAAGLFFFNPMPKAQAQPNVGMCGRSTPYGALCCSYKGCCMKSEGGGKFVDAHQDCGCANE